MILRFPDLPGESIKDRIESAKQKAQIQLEDVLERYGSEVLLSLGQNRKRRQADNLELSVTNVNSVTAVNEPIDSDFFHVYFKYVLHSHKFLLISHLSISYEYNVPIIEKDNVENQLQDANSEQFKTIATALTASLDQAKENSDIASDFIVPDSLETLPSSDPTIVEKILVIENESENQKLSSIFEVIVAQPITFEVALSELGGYGEEIEQEEIERWADKKLRSFLRDMILRSGLN